jgi:uncharacterized protein RhaS with RHS repeats
VGLYDYSFRHYSPQQKQWMTEDPIRDSRNWYSYVANNPVNLIDPLGLCVSYTDTLRAEKHEHNLYIYTDDDFGITGWVLALGEALKKGDFVFEFDQEKKEIIQVNLMCVLLRQTPP